MRIATGMALLLLLTAAGCGGDDEGVGNPLAPSGIAPTDTASGQSDASPAAAGQPGDLTGLVDGMRAAKVDKRTIDFSGVSWSWNTKRTHLEPSSLPDARVQTGSNVWRRDDGTGLIRILSDADLDGMSFSTAGGSWPLSMRRAGLYVSGITGAEVDQISSGGGGRGPRTNHPALQCWPSNTGRAPRLAAESAYAGTVSFVITITCNRAVDDSDGENRTRDAAATAAHFYAAVPASGTPPWSQGTVDANWLTKTPDVTVQQPTPPSYVVSAGFSFLRNTGSPRAGHLVWEASVPTGVTPPTLAARLVQQAAPDIECTLPTVSSFSGQAVDPRHNRLTWALPGQSSSCEYSGLELDVVTPSRSFAVRFSPEHVGGVETGATMATEYIHGALPTCPEQRCGALTADEATVTYKIRTTDFANHNAGPWSREVTVNRSTAATPSAPLYLRARHDADGYVELLWDKPAIPEDEAGVTYSFQAKAGGGSWRSFTAFSMCDGCSAKERLVSFADMPPVGRATPYRFQVRATHNGESGPWSNETNPTSTWDAPQPVTVRLGDIASFENSTAPYVDTAGQVPLLFSFTSSDDSRRRGGYATSTETGCEISVGNQSSYQLASGIMGLDCKARTLGQGSFSGLDFKWSQVWPGALPVNRTIWIRFSLCRGETICGPMQEIDITRNSDDEIVSQNADPPRSGGGGGGGGTPDPCDNGLCNQPPDPPRSEATYGNGSLTMAYKTTDTQTSAYSAGTDSSGNEVTIRRMEMRYTACPHRWDGPRSRFVRIGGAADDDDNNCRNGTGSGRSTGTITFRGSFGTIDGHQVDMWDTKMQARVQNSLGIWQAHPLWTPWAGGHVVQD